MVWRLSLSGWLALFASRGSGHSAAGLLHACDTYALLLWQSVVARVAPLSAFGADGSGEWLGPNVWRAQFDAAACRAE